MPSAIKKPAYMLADSSLRGWLNTIQAESSCIVWIGGGGVEEKGEEEITRWKYK